LAQALAKGVVVIFLALAQNLFDKDDNNEDNDNNNAFVSPLLP
jgi:hypothetical protein